MYYLNPLFLLLNTDTLSTALTLLLFSQSRSGFENCQSGFHILATPVIYWDHISVERLKNNSSASENKTHFHPFDRNPTIRRQTVFFPPMFFPQAVIWKEKVKAKIGQVLEERETKKKRERWGGEPHTETLRFSTICRYP